MLWLLTAVLLLLGAYISVLNWLCVVQGLRGRSTSSWIPLLGGVLGAVACVIAPDGALRHLWWVPLLADFGSAPGLAWTALASLFARRE